MSSLFNLLCQNNSSSKEISFRTNNFPKKFFQKFVWFSLLASAISTEKFHPKSWKTRSWFMKLFRVIKATRNNWWNSQRPDWALPVSFMLIRENSQRLFPKMRWLRYLKSVQNNKYKKNSTSARILRRHAIFWFYVTQGLAPWLWRIWTDQTIKMLFKIWSCLSKQWPTLKMTS